MNAIEVEGLSKRYVINHKSRERSTSLRELVSGLLPNFSKKVSDRDATINDEEHQVAKDEEFWALKDINFNVKTGERIAIIGGNGAGKSTLLKLLSRITEPTNGEIRLRGRVASLLEVGTGFHPELTGRENIYLNGAILGMRKQEISRKFDQIVNFSGVERFIDTPVKHYSSGMYVRLAFSVSAWLDPDILIVDEVLSVGDQAFQRRCTERMKELTSDGRTVLFVSHSMQAVRAMCEKALFLERGKAISFSSVEDAAHRYLRSTESADENQWCIASAEFEQASASNYIYSTNYIIGERAKILDSNNQINAKLEIDCPFQIAVEYRVIQESDLKLIPNFHIYDEQGNRVFIAYSEIPAPGKLGTHSASCTVDPFVLNTGRYYVTLVMSSFEWDSEYPHHFAEDRALQFEIFESIGSDIRRHGWKGIIPGVTRPRLNWNYTK